MKRFKWMAFGLFGILFSGMVLSSCKKDDVNQQQPDVAGLMAFNLAPDLDVVFTIDGNRLTNSHLSILFFLNFQGCYL